MPKYDSIETIPARIFFKILKDKDYQQLKPKPKEKGLKEVFGRIYDEFFVASDNPDAKEFLSIDLKIKAQEYKLTTIKRVLWFLTYTPHTREIREQWIDTLKSEFDIVINPDADFLSEVERVLTQEIGWLENDITADRITYDNLLKGLTPSTKEFNFYASQVALGNILQGNALVGTDMTLAVYVELDNAAKEIAKRQKDGK